MNLIDRAKSIFQSRGGTEALKQDVQELRDIAKSERPLSEKAKAGAEALKDPGAAGTPAHGATVAEPTEESAEQPTGSAPQPQTAEQTTPASVDPGPSGAGEPGAGEPGGSEPSGDPADADSRPA